MKKRILLTIALSALSASQAIAKVAVDVEVHTIKLNADAVVSVAENCTFTGWNKNENNAYFYANCDGIQESITVKNDNKLSDFVVKKAQQESSIMFYVKDYYGIDWDKASALLSAEG
jgi:hypothetical protein